MKKAVLLLPTLFYALSATAWWDHGHLVTAMIAYEMLEESAWKRVDELTLLLKRDYPYLNHFVTTGPWPDDLKAEGIRAYETWHYTDLPYNPDRVAISDRPEADIIWSINAAVDILRSDRSRDIEKARFLCFLVHFVSDIHQPMHSTSMFTDAMPGGDRGGNEYRLEGNWRKLHMLWDDGCGFLSDYNDINPNGQAKEPLTSLEISRIRDLARQLVEENPVDSFPNASILDPDFWALESHKLAISVAYNGLPPISDRSGRQYRVSAQAPSEAYLERGQAVVRRQLALAGYRLAGLLNLLFGERNDD